MSNSPIPRWQVTPQPGHQINSAAISADGGVCLLGTSEEYAAGEFGVFCYHRSGALMWQDRLDQRTWQGVFWVAVSADGGFAAAGGTLDGDATRGPTSGFLRAYDVAGGARLLDLTTPARVNQVALSDSGDILAAVAGNALLIHHRTDAGYRLLGRYAFADQYCQSCAISATGDRVVVGTAHDYDAPTGPAGTVTVFERDGDALRLRSQCPTDVAIIRVAMLPDASWWVASRHDGQAMAFADDVSVASGQAAWIYAPPGLSLGVAYAIAVARTEAGELRVVCGANLAGLDHGCLYAVSTQDQVPADLGHQPVPLWQTMLQFDPNPGVSMDRHARLVTATDGQPEGGGKESAGNFYLFAGDGTPIWQCPTPLMNWPMMVSAIGNAAFGASDDGSAYYWSPLQG